MLWFGLVWTYADRAFAGIPRPVENLRCECLRDEVLLRWKNAQDYEEILVVVDGQQFLLPGPRLAGQEEEERLPLGFGLHLIEVFGLINMEPTPPARCKVECLPQPDPAVADVLGPTEVHFAGEPAVDFVEVILDGSQSRGPGGERGLLYFWEPEDPADPRVKILNPRSAVTRVVFQGIGDVGVVLRVLLPPSNKLPDGATGFMKFTVQVGGEVVDRQVQFWPVHPLVLKVLADQERAHEFQLTVRPTVSRFLFRLLEGPPGMTVDEVTGRVTWSPVLDDVGRHGVNVVAEDLDQPGVILGEQQFAIEVLDPAVPALYFAADELGFGGEGGPDLAAPRSIVDRSGLPLGVDLHLNIPPGVSDCVVQLLEETDANGDRFFALHFDPRCENGGVGGGAGLSSGGMYYSGQSGNHAVFQNIKNDFTVELWLANVPDAQSGVVPPDGPAFAYSMGDENSVDLKDVNWFVGTLGPGSLGRERYVAYVNAGDATPAAFVETEADFSASKPQQLVLVRRGSTNCLYVNGKEAICESRAGSLDWSSSYQIFLGKAGNGSREFTGSVLMAAVYPEALPSGMIELLYGLGSTVPDPDDVPGPIASISPDPHDVSRDLLEFEGTDMQDRGGGAGAGAGLPGCDELLEHLRPFEWSVSPVDALSIDPLAGEEDCWRRVGIQFPDPRLPEEIGRRDYSVTLELTQIPVRGIVKTDSDTLSIRLPLDFRRGDANCDGSVDISDAIYAMLAMMRSRSSPAYVPCCWDAVDFDNNNAAEITDVILIARFVLGVGESPVPPAAPGADSCGLDARDPTDPLDCEGYLLCE